MDLGSLRRIESLAALSPSQLAQASRRLVWRRYRAGELIVPHQARIPLQGLVYRGRIQVSVVRQGQRHTVGYIHAQEPIDGRFPARDSLPTELRAVEATTLCLLPLDGLQPAASSERAAPVRRRASIAAAACLLTIALSIVLIAWRWPALWQVPCSKLAYGLASNLLEKGEDAKASRLLQTSLALNPRLDLAHNDLGTLYYRQGRIEQAQGAFRQAMAANPASAVAQNNLGLTYLESGDLVLALEALQRATALNPESAAAWANLGLAAHRLGRADEALRAYRAALRLEPDTAVVQANLGILHYEREQLSEARGLLQAALEGGPFLPHASAILGAIALNEREYDLAGVEFDQVGSALADDPLFHFYLALWSQETGDRENAEAELNRALALGPHPELASLIRSHLVVLASVEPSLSVYETKGE